MKRPALVGLISLLWLAIVTSLYYVSHKPFSPALAAGLLLATWRLGVALAILSAGGGLGRRLLPLHGFHPLSAAIVQAALGLGLLSLGFLILGVAGGVNRLATILLLAVPGGILLRDIQRWWGGWRELGALWKNSDRTGRAIGAGAGVILLFTLATALAPPVKYDALVYHLALPHAYIEAGRIVYVPSNMYWGMPQIGEMLYTWAILLGGDEAASTLGWMFGALACAGLVGLVAWRLGTRAAWIGLAAVLSGATLAFALGWSYVDWLAALFGLAFLVAMDVWANEGEGRHAWLAGVFAGLAVGAKYTAGVLVIAGLASILLLGERAPGRRRFALAFQYLLAASLAVSPWLVKNFLATGNPLYPFLLPGGAMDTFRLSLYQNRPAWAGWRDYLMLPWQATMSGLEGKAGYSASIGPLLLGLGLLGLVVAAAQKANTVETGDQVYPARERKSIQNAAVILVSGLLVWAAAGGFSAYLMQSRLYFALIPAAALLAAAGFSSLSELKWTEVRFGRIAGALVLMVLWLNVLEVGLLTLNQKPVSLLLGVESTQDYLEDNLGWYIRAAQAVKALPGGTRALMLWEPRSLYCAPKCAPDEVLDRWLRERHGGGRNPMASPDEILQAWRKEGYTHLLYYQTGAEFLREEGEGGYLPEDWQALETLLSMLPQPKDFGGDYLLYSLAQ